MRAAKRYAIQAMARRIAISNDKTNGKLITLADKATQQHAVPRGVIGFNGQIIVTPTTGGL